MKMQASSHVQYLRAQDKEGSQPTNMVTYFKHIVSLVYYI